LVTQGENIADHGGLKQAFNVRIFVIDLKFVLTGFACIGLSSVVG